MDEIAESLLRAVLKEKDIPREQMRRNVRKHIIAHEAAVRNLTAAAPDVRKDAIEEFRARFRACLDHEASNANLDTARHLREVVKIASEERTAR